jgi:L-iditol 2-dehydrogenase
MAAADAKALGAGLVVITGKVEERLDFPRSLPFIDKVFCALDADLPDKLLELTGGQGFDIALEATGVQAATDTALKALKIGGHLAIVGTKGNITFNAPYVLSKAIKITGDMLFLPEDYATVIDLMKSKKLNIRACATTVTSLEKVEKYLGEKETESGKDAKVLVKL